MIIKVFLYLPDLASWYSVNNNTITGMSMLAVHHFTILTFCSQNYFSPLVFSLLQLSYLSYSCLQGHFRRLACDMFFVWITYAAYTYMHAVTYLTLNTLQFYFLFMDTSKKQVLLRGSINVKLCHSHNSVYMWCSECVNILCGALSVLTFCVVLLVC